MTLKLVPASKHISEQALQWRTHARESLRTPIMLVSEQQDEFFKNVICDRNSHHRYWGIANTSHNYVVGFGGLTNISWENGSAEISLIIDTARHGRGLGQQSVALLLREGFDVMRLGVIYGECYHTNERTVSFWSQLTEKYGGITVTLPDRKFWNGDYYSSMYFSINHDDWRNRNGKA